MLQMLALLAVLLLLLILVSPMREISQCGFFMGYIVCP